MVLISATGHGVWPFFSLRIVRPRAIASMASGGAIWWRWPPLTSLDEYAVPAVLRRGAFGYAVDEAAALPPEAGDRLPAVTAGELREVESFGTDPGGCAGERWPGSGNHDCGAIDGRGHVAPQQPP